MSILRATFAPLRSGPLPLRVADLGALPARRAALIFLFAVIAPVAAAQGLKPSQAGVLELLLKWTPLIFSGFLFNILVSIVTMLVATTLGVMLGAGMCARSALVRGLCRPPVLFFRNAPWLVVLFGVMLLVPYEFRLFGLPISLPAWIKAVFGLSLPVMANIAETVRGAILSLPKGQWEAAGALSLSPLQTQLLVILPQAVRRIIPPWMNQYAILTMNTTIISIVGIQEGLTIAQAAQVAEGRADLLLPIYLMLLAMFFAYCYPIARLTLMLERRLAERG